MQNTVDVHTICDIHKHGAQFLNIKVYTAAFNLSIFTIILNKGTVHGCKCSSVIKIDGGGGGTSDSDLRCMIALAHLYVPN